MLTPFSSINSVLFFHLKYSGLRLLLDCIADDTYLDWFSFGYHQTIENAFLMLFHVLRELLSYPFQISTKCYHTQNLQSLCHLLQKI